MGVLLGAIADDFTGATDLCNTLVRRGMRTVQLIGVPAESAPPPDAEAVVVALKSRTIPAAEAVATSLAALAWLRRAGARQILFKYCSTFDSTDAGQYRPGRRGAAGRAWVPTSPLFCPAFPENGRTIYQGLSVRRRRAAVGIRHARPPADADARPQPRPRPAAPDAAARSGSCSTPRSREGRPRSAPPSTRCAPAGIRHAIVDAIADADLEAIGEAAADLPADHRRLGHRAGLAGEFPPPGPARRRRRRRCAAARSTGAAAVLSGSCSEATRAQVAFIARARAGLHDRPARGGRRARMSRRRRSTGRRRCSASGRCWSRPPRRRTKSPPCSSARARARRGAGRGHYGAGRVAASSSAACGGSSSPAARPSGAVVQALGVTGLRIGRQIDPGVPWTVEPRRADAGAGAQIRQFRRRPISFCAPLTCLSGAAT